MAEREFPACLPAVGLIACAVLAAFAANGCMSGLAQSFYSDLPKRESSYPSAEMCRDCHVAIHEEWAGSAHARAYVSETYREGSGGYEFRGCLPCHIPDSVFAERIAAREEIREEGVTCAACHLHEGKYAGPLEPSALILPHPVEFKAELYRSAALCGKCHEGTYREWLAVERQGKPTCQECHMREVVRTPTQATGLFSSILIGFEEEGKLRRHRFELSEIEDLEGAVDFAASVVSRSGDRLEIRLDLASAVPHRIPSGDFGFRKAALAIEALDAEGNPLESARREYVKGLGTSIPACGAWQEIFEVPGKTASLGVSLERVDRSRTVSVHRGKWAVPK